jgi:hypothetical protein
MDIKVLGAGMDELRGSYIEITNQQIKNIAASFGIPNSTFISDENSYATALSDIKLWYTSSEFVRIYQTIEDTLSSQLWARFGWSMEYEPEKLEAFQQEETDKSGALSTLSGAFATNPGAALVAADVLGYDLTEEQIAAIAALGVSATAAPVPVLPVDPMQMLPSADGMPLPSAEENSIANSLMAWRRFAVKPQNVGHEYDDKSKLIPAALKLRISIGLRAAKSADEMQTVFDAAALELPIIRLADAINKAAVV